MTENITYGQSRTELEAAVKTFDTTILDTLRDSAHRDRDNLMAQKAEGFWGPRRESDLIYVDMIISVLEEELAERAGLASSEEILAAVEGQEWQNWAQGTTARDAARKLG